MQSWSDTNSLSSQSSNFHFPSNPFDDANRIRLEHSVLSPNIFQIAHTSTPEVTKIMLLFRLA
jgi:hypothetical protein